MLLKWEVQELRSIGRVIGGLHKKKCPRWIEELDCRNFRKIRVCRVLFKNINGELEMPWMQFSSGIDVRIKECATQQRMGHRAEGTRSPFPNRKQSSYSTQATRSRYADRARTNRC